MIRDALESDFDAILRLNAASERLLSPLDAAQLAALHRQAAWHRVITDGGVEGFLLALREGADYASPNYRWFASRYERFLYVDRIVIDAAWRGHGLGTMLYEDLFAQARALEIGTVACEYDLDPPNEASRRFHAGFGFAEVGQQQAGAKTVSLQVARL